MTYTVTFSADANGSLSGTISQLVGEHANCRSVTAVPHNIVIDDKVARATMEFRTAE